MGTVNIVSDLYFLRNGYIEFRAIFTLVLQFKGWQYTFFDHFVMLTIVIPHRQ